jgi:hypothetical protein
MHFLDALENLTPQLPHQPTYFRWGRFRQAQQSGRWLPAGSEPLAFPLLMADRLQLQLSPDLRLARWRLALLYGEPAQYDGRDTRTIQQRGERQLQALLSAACAALDAELAEAPELSFFSEAGPNRLAGVNALVAFRVANETACC